VSFFRGDCCTSAAWWCESKGGREGVCAAALIGRDEELKRGDRHVGIVDIKRNVEQSE